MSVAEQMAEVPRVELSAAKRALLEARLRGRVRVAGIERRDRGQGAPLSFAQERLWFLDRLQPGGTGYNVTAALRLGAVQPRALERALAEVVRRHEVLRTTFHEVDGVPVQVAAPAEGFTLPVEDLSGLDPAAREAETRRRLARESAHPFDLTAGPLFRATLLRHGAQEHVLLLNMHHIVTDGWSMGILFRELRALEAAYREGLPAPLPELPLQYADYAAWQREQGRGEGAERRLAYWRDRLAGAPELLELPTDRPRPPVPSFRGAGVPVHLSAEVLDRLRALGRREGATLYMVVLAAFQLLLSRYAGSGDVVVGTPVAGRTRPEVEGLIGFFVNTLVLRTDVSGDPSFRALLARVRETVLGAYEHQDLPFERLVAELQPERSLSHAPLFQVVFLMEDAAPGGEAAPGAAGRPVQTEFGTIQFDLTLSLAAHPDGLRGTLSYAAELFDQPSMERMGAHLQRVLEQVAAAPDLPLSRVELMGAMERRRVLEEWSRPAQVPSAGRCVHELVAEQAARTPDAVAVALGADALTYRELDGRANRLARWLRRHGVAPEARVGLCLERGPELVTAMLGVLRAGAAYVPLDPAYPAERLALVAADSGIAVLLASEALRGRLPARPGVRVVALDAVRAQVAAESDAPPAVAVDPRQLAYVIYTSGSTGTPKGVAVEHAGLANMCAWYARAFGITAADRLTQFASPGFDAVGSEVWPCLIRGACLDVVPDEARTDPARLRDWLVERAATLSFAPTPVGEALLELPWPADAALRTLVIAGDRLRARPRPGMPFAVANNYGPTECSIGATSALAVEPGGERAPSIGRPIDNTPAYVLDAWMRPVPAGVPGELWLGGVQVARGYLDRPALTARSFVPDPFSARPGARLYRTGDRVRWLADGTLDYLGRVDEQVKIRGFRIEPGEVEALLLRHGGVAECAVVVREDAPGDRRLVAYVTGGADPEALRESLRGTLPEYMVPAAVVGVERLPLTPHGKLDRRALPAPEYRGAEGADAEPRDYLEVQLIQLWEELLGTRGIGPQQSFFDLGGSSLLAMRLFAQANRRLECDLPLSTLFTGATVRHMADAIRRQRGEGAYGSPVVPLQPHGSLPPLFIVHSADRNVMGYVSLVRHLGAEQPAFGVRDTGDLARPVAVIAAGHVQAIRTVQPRGPYALCGWSFGGFVVFEMAVQLQRAGEEVSFVGLMDTMSPALEREWPRLTDAETPVMLAREVAARIRRPFAFDARTLEGLSADEQVRRVAEALREQGAAPADFDAAALAGQCDVIYGRYASLAGYEPGRFSGTLTLFRADAVPEQHAAFFAPRAGEVARTLGWCLHADAPVEVHRVPGSHSTIASEPQVRVLAERMRESLARARERAGVPGGAR
ncbi:MAG TPA: amino acid adenylation domain-containing protein [Longimicrobium sp.]